MVLSINTDPATTGGLHVAQTAASFAQARNLDADAAVKREELKNYNDELQKKLRDAKAAKELRQLELTTDRDLQAQIDAATQKAYTEIGDAQAQQSILKFSGITDDSQWKAAYDSGAFKDDPYFDDVEDPKTFQTAYESLIRARSSNQSTAMQVTAEQSIAQNRISAEQQAATIAYKRDQSMAALNNYLGMIRDRHGIQYQTVADIQKSKLDHLESMELERLQAEFALDEAMFSGSTKGLTGFDNPDEWKQTMGPLIVSQFSNTGFGTDVSTPSEDELEKMQSNSFELAKEIQHQSNLEAYYTYKRTGQRVTPMTESTAARLAASEVARQYQQEAKAGEPHRLGVVKGISIQQSYIKANEYMTKYPGKIDDPRLARVFPDWEVIKKRPNAEHIIANRIHFAESRLDEDSTRDGQPVRGYEQEIQKALQEQQASSTPKPAPEPRYTGRWDSTNPGRWDQ